MPQHRFTGGEIAAAGCLQWSLLVCGQGAWLSCVHHSGPHAAPVQRWSLVSRKSFTSTLLKLLSPCSSLCRWACMTETGAQVLENKPRDCSVCYLTAIPHLHLWKQGCSDSCPYPKRHYFHGEKEEAPSHRGRMCGFQT